MATAKFLAMKIPKSNFKETAEASGDSGSLQNLSIDNFRKEPLWKGFTMRLKKSNRSRKGKTDV